MSDQVVVSVAVRPRSFSPSSLVLHPRMSALGFCRSTNVPDAISVHFPRARSGSLSRRLVRSSYRGSESPFGRTSGCKRSDASPIDYRSPFAPSLCACSVVLGSKLLEAPLSFPHSTQPRAEVDPLVWRGLPFCWHYSDWPRTFLKIIENVSWDKSCAGCVHVPVAIPAL